MPDMAPPTRRTLSEAEFNALEDQVLQSAPKGLTEEELDRYVEPRLADEIGKAEYTPPGPRGSALSRVGQSLADTAKGVLTGFWNLSPKAIEEGMRDQWNKAKTAFGEGRYSEAAGHGAATLPLIGPGAAAAGEQIASGDVAGGLTSGAAQVGMAMSPTIAKAAKAPVGRGVSAVGRGTEWVGKAAEEAGPAVTRAALATLASGPVAGMAAAVGPPLLKRGGQILQRGGERLSGPRTPTATGGYRPFTPDEAASRVTPEPGPTATGGTRPYTGPYTSEPGPTATGGTRPFTPEEAALRVTPEPAPTATWRQAETPSAIEPAGADAAIETLLGEPAPPSLRTDPADLRGRPASSFDAPAREPAATEVEALFGEPAPPDLRTTPEDLRGRPASSLEVADAVQIPEPAPSPLRESPSRGEGVRAGDAQGRQAAGAHPQATTGTPGSASAAEALKAQYLASIRKQGFDKTVAAQGITPEELTKVTGVKPEKGGGLSSPERRAAIKQKWESLKSPGERDAYYAAGNQAVKDYLNTLETLEP